MRYESVRRARGGELIPVEISSSLTEVEGELVVLSISRDIRERQREVRRLQELTLRDELTGLLNRRGLDVMLPEQAKRSKRSGRPVIVVYGDIDHFKALNDTYGHERGDEVLVAVAGGAAGGLPRDGPDRPPRRRRVLRGRRGGRHRPGRCSASAWTPRCRSPANGSACSVGLSHGEVATDWRGVEDPRAVLADADARMYAAKQARND